MIAPKGLHAVAGREGVLACFDATAASIFSWICRLVGSDGDLADELLADVYLRLGQATADGTVTDVDDDWLVSTAFHLAVQFDLAHGPLHADLSVRDRALLDLDLGRSNGFQRDADAIARIVGVSTDDVVAELAAAERAAGAATTESVAGMLLRSERWLDDATRRRARLAIVRGERTRTDSRSAEDPPPNLPPARISRSSISPAPLGERSAPPPAGPGADLAQPRRLTIGVAAGIAAMLAVGYVWITPDDSAERGNGTTAASTNSNAPEATDRGAQVTGGSETASDPSTTEAAPTGSTVSSYAARLSLSPGFILGEPVADFVPVSVWEEPASFWQDQPAESWRQIWSEPGASRTSGRWFAIAFSRWDSFPHIQPAGTERISFDGHSGVSTTERDGVAWIEMSLGAGPAEGPTVILTGYGLGLDELQLLAGSVVWDETASLTEVAEIEFGPAAEVVLQRMALVDSRPIICCGVRSYRTQGDRRAVSYRSGPPDETGEYLTVSTLDGWSNELDSRFLEPSSPDPAAPDNPERTLQIGDRTVTVTGDVYSDGTTDYAHSSVRWFQGSQTIEISGNFGLTTLLSAVSAARPAQHAEWRALAAIVPEQEISPDGPPVAPRYTSVGDVRLANGTAWSLAMSIDPSVIRISYRDRRMTVPLIERSFVEDPLRPVLELVTTHATVLVITLRDPPAGSAVNVTVAGREPVLVALVPVGGSGLVAAIDAFSELPPYTVELVDEAGTTLQRLNP